MGKYKCPQCHHLFNDDLKRYVIGSTTNSIKFATHIGLRFIGGTLGAPFGEMTRRAGSRLGKEFAESIGCGEKNMTGWHHKCPYCGHRWR